MFHYLYIINNITIIFLVRKVDAIKRQEAVINVKLKIKLFPCSLFNFHFWHPFMKNIFLSSAKLQAINQLSFVYKRLNILYNRQNLTTCIVVPFHSLLICWLEKNYGYRLLFSSKSLPSISVWLGYTGHTYDFLHQFSTP